MEQPQRKQNPLETEPIGRLIRRYSIPTALTLMVNYLYNIVDQIFVGQGVGVTGMAATNVAFPLTIVTIALALMIVGHLRVRRQWWLLGGLLIGVVVAKLFFVELGNRGGLERIVSFIGVGVLLLVVGYFAPLPPRQDAAPAQGVQG